MSESLHVTIAATTDAVLNVNGDTWAIDPVVGSSALRPGKIIRITGTWGRMSYSNTRFRISSVSPGSCAPTTRGSTSSVNGKPPWSR